MSLDVSPTRAVFMASANLQHLYNLAVGGALESLKWPSADLLLRIRCTYACWQFASARGRYRTTPVAFSTQEPAGPQLWFVIASFFKLRSLLLLLLTRSLCSSLLLPTAHRCCSPPLLLTAAAAAHRCVLAKKEGNRARCRLEYGPSFP
jgi:hypothetical protein